MLAESEQSRKRVWVLGAGFSRSLRGPLMSDLLSLATRWQIRATYAKHISLEETDLVFWLFQFGMGFPDGPLDPDYSPRGERRWQDAEQFLEILDNARFDPAGAELVRAVFMALKSSVPLQSIEMMRSRYPLVFDKDLPALNELAAMVRRTIAASCCTFLEGVTCDSARKKERWRPYQQWLGSLRQHDSILTFNYDRVVELLSPTVRYGAAGSSHWGVHVLGLQNTVQERDRKDMAKAKLLPTLYKLHGSVNWRIVSGQVDPADWAPTLLERGTDLAIATPGDSKMQMAIGVFGKLWEEAAQVLREADDVFVIGFRFPPSDAFPRDRLLTPLSENKRESLNVHVILGPDQNADLRRVLALLHMTVLQKPQFDEIDNLNARALITHSMWAEDFLSAWARQEATRRGNEVPTVDSD